MTMQDFLEANHQKSRRQVEDGRKNDVHVWSDLIIFSTRNNDDGTTHRVNGGLQILSGFLYLLHPRYSELPLGNPNR